MQDALEEHVLNFQHGFSNFNSVTSYGLNNRRNRKPPGDLSDLMVYPTQILTYLNIADSPIRA